MNQNRNGRKSVPFRLHVLLFAIVLALFGAPALAQGAAQENAQQDGAQSESAEQNAADQPAEPAGDQTVIQLGPDEVITQAEFEQEFERATRALALQQGLPYNEQTRELFESFRADFLDQLAVRNALLIEAEARGISVSDQEVEEQISQLQTNLGEEQFQQAVQDLGYDSVDAFRASVHEGLLTQRVIDELRAGIEVTDEQVQTFYEENQDLFAGQELDQVREQVRAQLVDERLTEQFAGLRQDHGIQTFPERVVVETEADEGVAGGGEADQPTGTEETPAGGADGADGAVDPDVVQPDTDAPFAEEDVEPDEVPAVEDVEDDRGEEGLGAGEDDPLEEPQDQPLDDPQDVPQNEPQ